MKSLVLLLCFAQLWGCQSAPQGTGLGFRELACDDPEAEQVALLAVDYLNNHLLQGFKQVLNQIDKVKVWSRRPFGVVYEMEVDTLETTCHALDPTPLANLMHNLGGEEVSVACKLFQTQPQPANANAVGPVPTANAALPADPPASVVVGPVVVPRGLSDHRTYHDLRHAFSPVASVESASGETLHSPKVGQPGAAGPVSPMCPGRIRHFKI
ncbi:alpha-2-HS-glycoprotein isoform 2 precursor [Mus musculus]|uniref:alpha-2-HS-glycoprotein isoform 2 precursor n=1 Tax=Mus musculus TaxID=10090 RepID=UPI0002B608FC|nr:alpha-2-HS-glycoprotein isoform 2 precursor [Mus musculus]|eukprot:NP_001263378.1 alpha-2-HS-glycoprotein isoform 2 precursor [Mus musculus]